MMLNKYLLSSTMPGTARAKKTPTQGFHMTQEADIQKQKLQSNLEQKIYCDRISSEDQALQFYFIFNAGKTSS